MICYHYTDFNALKSIIEKEEIWMTDLRYMNDFEELENGMKSLKSYFYERSNEIGAKKINDLESITQSITKDFMTFSASFCMDNDKLSQWRSYGKNGGFSIGFDLECFVGHENIRPCIYKDDEKNHVLEEIFEEFKDFDLTNVEGKVSEVLIKIWRAMSSFKNYGFHEEREVRIVDVARKEKKFLSGMEGLWGFRMKSDLMIPYAIQKIKLEYIKKITIGPSKNFELIKESLDLILLKKSIEMEKRGLEFNPSNIEIRKSEISYRES